MNHIFYIHSNILSICCYQTVQEALAHNDKVIIITNRNCQWPFFLDKVTVFDFANIFYGEDKKRVALHSLKAIKDYIRYRRYRCHLDKVVRNIIDGKDFIYYMPSMALDMTASFAYNKHCIGYYYVDEGSLAYLPQDIINQQFASNAKNAVKRLLKIEDHCHYEVLPSYRGTISITNDAFKWNVDGERIINPIDQCVLELSKGLLPFDDVIVTARLDEDTDIVTNSLDYTIERIIDNYPNSKIGIKIHPNAITYNETKTSRVLKHIQNKYGDRVAIIPKEVSIEIMSLIYHPRLYSLFSLSSLILYGLLFKSSEGYLVKNDESNTISVLRISTVEEYYKLISKVNLGK